ATNSTGEGEWSVSHSFTTKMAKPGEVTRISPVDGAEDQPIRPTLSWQPSTNTYHYDVQIGTTMDFEEGDIVYEKTNLESPAKSNPEVTASYIHHEVEEDLDNNTTYYWRIRSKNTDVTGDWSDEPWSFTTLQALPSQVLLTSPTDG